MDMKWIIRGSKIGWLMKEIMCFSIKDNRSSEKIVKIGWKFVKGEKFYNILVNLILLIGEILLTAYLFKFYKKNGRIWEEESSAEFFAKTEY